MAEHTFVIKADYVISAFGSQVDDVSMIAPVQLTPSGTAQFDPETGMTNVCQAVGGWAVCGCASSGGVRRC